MTIAEEMRLKREIASPRHEALLGLLRTAGVVGKLADRFFGALGLTTAQYNTLIILRDFDEGLSQVDLSQRQLVNRANMTGLVDRLEERGWVRRCADPADRRSWTVRLTASGRKFVERVEVDYKAEVEKAMACFSAAEARTLAGLLERLRSALVPRL